MTYQVLARKWRPQDFSSLVGQEPIVTALRNALRERRIAQAYIFSGIRGVGKTTAARVLAKALNCERGSEPGQPAVDPCNECPSCRDITIGKDLDVREVDAATYSKVEQIRELTIDLRDTAATNEKRYMVVVLDEVHRLSRQAFDALLKIVEEPPPRLVFIFATTELDAVPATILSRCQEFQFRRVPSPVLAKHLQHIAKAESIEVSETSLRFIARAGEGSVRDSVALLDQLATFGNGTITDQDAKNLLGGLDAAIFIRLLKAILQGDRGVISETVAEVEANGWDPHNVYGQFLSFTRDALQLAVGGSADSVDLPKEEAESLTEVVRESSYENLLRMIQLLLNSEMSVKRSEFGALALQITWLRAAELPKVVNIQDLLTGRAKPPVVPDLSADSGRSSTSGRPAGSKPSPSEVALSEPPAELRRTVSDGPKFDAATAASMDQPSSTTEAVAAESNLHESADSEVSSPPSRTSLSLPSIPEFLRQLGSRRPSLAPLLKRCADDIAFKNGCLQIPKGDRLLEEALERQGNRKALETTLTEIAGRGAGWQWIESKKSSRRQDATPTKKAKDSLQAARDLPAVSTVLDVFGGKIQSIEHEEETPE